VGSHQRDPVPFLVSWVALPFLFFSLSSAKLPGYILPVFPPLAILTGVIVSRILRDSQGKGRWPLLLPGFSIVLIISFLVFFIIWPEMLPRALKKPMNEVYPSVQPLLMPLASFLLLVFPWVVWSSLKAKQLIYFLTSCLALCLFFFLNQTILSPVSSMRSSYELALKSASLISPGDQIVLYDVFPESLPFYLRISRPVWIVWSGRKSNVMGSIYIAEKQPTPAPRYGRTLLTFEEFSNLWQESASKLCVFVKEKDLTKFYEQVGIMPYRLVQVKDIVLLANQPQ
jgi:hypothetical protein